MILSWNIIRNVIVKMLCSRQ